MKKLKYIFFILVALLLRFELALAQGSVPLGGGTDVGPTPQPSGGVDVGGRTTTIDNPLSSGVDTIPELLSLLIERFVLPIGGVIVVFMIIYTGFKFVIARGNESKLADAKKTLLHTIIGAAIILGAAAISVIIRTTLGDIVDTIR